MRRSAAISIEGATAPIAPTSSDTPSDRRTEFLSSL